MTDMLRAGSDWLEKMRSKHCTSSITYQRGALSGTFFSTFARTDYEVDDDLGFRVGIQMVDFLILASDFTPTFGSPEVADRIVADGVTYEVMSLAGQGTWRWSDPYRTTMRIHVKEVSA